MKLRAIVLAGGSGTRLWPLTRHLPKQLIPFRGSTLLEQTLDRIAPCASAGIVVVTTAEYKDRTHACINSYGARCLIEPSARNTALAVAYALADPLLEDDTILCILPSDHVIDDSVIFRQAIMQGAEWAAHHKIPVLYGVRPTSASSLYGYIQYVSAYTEPYRVAVFIEKPASDYAQELCARGDVLWNCGIVCAPVCTLRSLYKQYAQEQYYAACEAVQGNYSAWMECASQPLDRIVLERAPELAVMPLGCSWADVGSLEQFLRHAGATYSSSGRIIMSEIPNIGVIDTDECIIIAPLAQIDTVTARARIMLARENV